MRNKTSHGKRLWPRLVLLAASIFLTLLLMEGVFALFPDILPAPIRRHLDVSAGRTAKSIYQRAYEHDPILEHRATLGFVGREETSELSFEFRTVALPGLEPWGWRSEKFDPERSLDFIILGDSFATGYGVKQEDTLAGRIIDDYRRQGKQAFNLGLSNNTGTLQYELILRRALEHYSPKKVLLMHFENDYVENTFFSKWKQARQSGNSATTRFPQSRGLWESVCADQENADSDASVSQQPKQVFSRTRTFLYKHSSVWNILRCSLHLHPYSLAESGEFIGFGKVSYIVSHEFRAQVTAHDRPCVRQGYEQARDALTRIKELLDRRGIELCVMLIPFKESLLDPDDADVGQYHVVRNGIAT
ncbi:MAG: hypothetical protein GY758_14805 [Fuerstiella sp.]|nr:hypothetical protein [Fuerstiella sp.]